MIHNVSFMGREEYLTKPAKKVVDKTHEYLGASSIIEDTAPKAKQVVENGTKDINEAFRAKYAPFTIKDDAKAAEEAMAESYKVSHGN